MQTIVAIDILKIVLLCIAAAVVYGVLHDQVTARVCVEYFTIGHPPIFHTDSPTLLALGWGVVATWWAGAILGVLAALCSRVGTWPKCSARDLLRPICVLLTLMAVAASAAGIVAYWAASSNRLVLFDPLGSRIPPAKHAAFLADAGAHLASYGVGFVGGFVVCGWILYRRWQSASH